MSTAMDIAYQEGATHHVTLPHQTGYLLCRRMRVVHIVMRLSAFGARTEGISDEVAEH